MLKAEDNTKGYDEDFNINKTKHQIMATIQTRSVDPKVLTTEKVDNYVKKLKEIVKGHSFEGHVVLKHGDDCPEASVDVFTMPNSKRYADMQGMQGDPFGGMDFENDDDGMLEEDQSIEDESLHEEL